MVSQDKKFVQSVVSDDLKAWLKARADAEGRSLSNLIAVLLEKARQEAGTGRQEKKAK